MLFRFQYVLSTNSLLVVVAQCDKRLASRTQKGVLILRVGVINTKRGPKFLSGLCVCMNELSKN